MSEKFRIVKLHICILQLLLTCLAVPTTVSALSYVVTTNDLDGDGVRNSTELGIGTDPNVFNQFDGYVDSSTFTYAFNLYDLFLDKHPIGINLAHKWCNYTRHTSKV